MEQHSCWSVINAFRGGYQLNSAFTQSAHNINVITAIPSETVNLMYNYVVYPVSIFLHVFQHFLEFRAVSGFSGSSPVNKLLTDHCAHGERLFLVGFPLGWNRKTLISTAATLCLPARRDTEVGHGEFGRHSVCQ